jgi:mannose-6-phosphate isomerase-like protein (cupin superfamily)
VTGSVDLAGKPALAEARWSPRIVAGFDGHDVMAVKVLGEFVWHDHPDTDDFFPVLRGEPTIGLPDGAVVLGPGQMFVVPKGVQHRPRAAVETHLLLIEPAGTPNTGDPATAVVKTAV